jgi:hypothetical protein
MGNKTNVHNSKSDWLRAWLDVLSRNPLDRNQHDDHVIYVEAYDFPEGASLESWISVLQYLAPDNFVVVAAACGFDTGTNVWYGEWHAVEQG